MRAPPESLIPMTGQPILAARSMTLHIFSLITSPSDPPKTVKSCENTHTRRPSMVPWPVTTASDHGRLLVHPELVGPVAGEDVGLLEGARIEQLLDPLARGVLAAVVLLGDRGRVALARLGAARLELGDLLLVGLGRVLAVGGGLALAHRGGADLVLRHGGGDASGGAPTPRSSATSVPLCGTKARPRRAGPAQPRENGRWCAAPRSSSTAVRTVSTCSWSRPGSPAGARRAPG